MTTERIDDLLASRGSATPQELGLTPAKVIDLARKRPELEPVFLVRFRSRQNKVRVDEVRAYGWNSQQIALRHLGYQAEDARLLRIEPRRQVPFPDRLYATYAAQPKVLEELRAAEKAYRKAIKQASSKPGRAEMDLTALLPAFKKLGEEVAYEMWIDAASVFQELDNASYSAKMLGNLLKQVSANKKADPSMLARVVLAAADDGVFNTKLYDFTFDLVQTKVSLQDAIGFALRVFRRLMASGRALPTDFVKDMSRAAKAAKSFGADAFDKLFDGHLLWAASQPSFWNTAKKTSSWRSAPTEDHCETSLLRKRLRELWARATEAGQAGEAWKQELWGRLMAAMPELSAYGRVVLAENALEMASPTPSDLRRALEASLSMLARAPRQSDRERLEKAAQAAFGRLGSAAPDLLWECAPQLEQALTSASGDLVSFVGLHDLLADVSESLPKRTVGEASVDLLHALRGLEGTWIAALVTALVKTEGNLTGAAVATNNTNKKKSDDQDSGKVALLPPLGEALSLLRPDTCAQHLAELAPYIASRLAKDISGGNSLAAWERILGTLHGLGLPGQGVAMGATATFVERSGRDTDLAQAAELVHLLDGDALRRAAEAHELLDEALQKTVEEASLPFEVKPMAMPAQLPKGRAKQIGRCRDGEGWQVLWVVEPAKKAGAEDADDDDVDDSNQASCEAKQLVMTRLLPDGSQTVSASGNQPAGTKLSFWAHQRRVILTSSAGVQLLDLDLKKVHALTLDEDVASSFQCLVPGFHCGMLVFDNSRRASLVTPELEQMPNATYEGDRWGGWTFIEGNPGTLPVVIRRAHGGRPEFVVPAPGQKLLRVNLPDLSSIAAAIRTETEWFLDYHDRKGQRRRARPNEAGDGWVCSDATQMPERVLDLVLFGDSGHVGVPFNGTRLAVDGDGIKDAFGQKLARVGSHTSKRVDLDLQTGLAVFEDAVGIDPSLPKRIQAAGLLRSAITGESGEALPRALYSNAKGLGRHLLDALKQRPAAKQSLDALEGHAAPLLESTAESLQKLLAAREKILVALESTPPPIRQVPAHRPGVSRSDLRRALRSRFGGSLEGLLFWALDGDDPELVARSLLPKGQASGHEPWSLGMQLVALAQQPSTSRALAERLLSLADSLHQGLSEPGLVFQSSVGQDGFTPDEEPKVRTLDGGAPFVFAYTGTYAKNEAPIPLEKDAEQSKELLRDWIARSLLAPLSPSEVVFAENDSRSNLLGGEYISAKVFRATLPHQGRQFEMKVAAFRDEKGLAWWLDRLSAKAPADVWASFLATAEAALKAGHAASEGPLWPATGVAVAADREALGRGIAFTRSRLDSREALSLESWPVPELAKVDPRYRRYVVLAWLFGEIDASKVGTTTALFEKIGKDYPKLVSKTWRGLQAQCESRSLEYRKLIATSLFRLGSRRDEDELDNLLLLRDPAEICEAVAKEIAGAKN